MNAHQKRGGRRRGSAILEASLILMLFLTIWFGCFDFGFALFQYQTFVHHARAGARYGVVNPTNLTAVRNMVMYDNASLPNGKSEGAPGVLGLTPSMVAVARADPGEPNDRITITISNYRVVFFGPALAGSFLGKPIQVSLPVEVQ